MDDAFDRPDITYVNPGRKDNVYAGKKDGERQYVQKRYLLWSLKELLEILNGAKTDCGASSLETFGNKFGKDLTFSTLYNYVKSRIQLIFNRDIPHGSCLCEICENACLLAKGINKSKKTSLETNPHDLVKTPIQNRVFTVNVVNAQILVVLKKMEQKVKAMVKVAKLMVLLLESERVVFPFYTGVDKTKE